MYTLIRQSITRSLIPKQIHIYTVPAITRTFRTTSINMGKEDIVTAYQSLLDIKPQEQNLPGTDTRMDPLAEFTKLECWDDDGKPYLKEYVGSGKLKGKTALITGGDSGIGRSAAQMFVREGAQVTIVYLEQEQEDAERVKKAIEEDGGQCLCLPLDLMKEESAKKAVDEHLKKYGSLDILVNNASKQMMCKDLADIEMKDVESTFRSNILGMFALTKYALPHLKRGASIINSASVVAFKGSPAMMDYSSTKGAIVTFTRSLAMQLAPKGIRVNAVCPGPVYTPLQPASRPAEQMDDWNLGSLPLWGRVNMPAEMGPAYVFLASADSNAMTGQMMHLNNAQWIG